MRPPCPASGTGATVFQNGGDPPRNHSFNAEAFPGANAQKSLLKKIYTSCTPFFSMCLAKAEQAKGMAAHPADDVYSPAVILHQLCAGSLKPLEYIDDIDDLDAPEAKMPSL